MQGGRESALILNIQIFTVSGLLKRKTSNPNQVKLVISYFDHLSLEKTLSIKEPVKSAQITIAAGIEPLLPHPHQDPVSLYAPAEALRST